jgi:hypothetical protein
MTLIFTPVLPPPIRFYRSRYVSFAFRSSFRRYNGPCQIRRNHRRAPPFRPDPQQRHCMKIRSGLSDFTQIGDG